MWLLLCIKVSERLTIEKAANELHWLPTIILFHQADLIESRQYFQHLKYCITDLTIQVGDYTMVNDFVNDPCDFEKNKVLVHYPINHDQLIIGKFCSIIQQC